MDDKPEVRIGTSERERAQSALSEHFSEGRLDMPEFEERSSLAAAARTVGDLAAVFIDLPGGLPDALSAPRVQSGRPARRRASFGVLRASLGLVLMLLLMLGVFSGHGWLLFLILPISGAARRRTMPAAARPIITHERVSKPPLIDTERFKKCFTRR